MHSLETGRPIRSVADFAEKIKDRGGAPIAIWLGIMLDGIPEFMVSSRRIGSRVDAVRAALLKSQSTLYNRQAVANSALPDSSNLSPTVGAAYPLG